MDAFDPGSRRFVRAKGNYLFDAAERRLFDAVSSIWTTVHGHCHPHITAAISRQARELDHSTLLGATHPRAEELADKLSAMLRMDRVFFGGDGASAIEAALKMVLQYWQFVGEPQRTRFVRLTGAYHGDTAGAMSVSAIETFKTRFGALIFESLSYEEAPAVLERDDVAAVIVEPIVQAAAGLRKVAKEQYAPLRGMKPLLIVDEIATGFGRTGTMFAHEQLGIEPDVVTLGKGLTGGTLPLSATVVKNRVFEAFRGTREAGNQFFHGHSYAGNPITCAAALASLELFDLERTMERVRDLELALESPLQALRRHPRVREVRRAGLMIGIELRQTRAHDVAGALYDRGYFTRPIGEVIQLVPPLSSTFEELTGFIDSLHVLLD